MGTTRWGYGPQHRFEAADPSFPKNVRVDLTHLFDDFQSDNYTSEVPLFHFLCLSSRTQPLLHYMKIKGQLTLTFAPGSCLGRSPLLPSLDLL